MGREFPIGIHPNRCAMQFFNDDYRPDLPREVPLYVYDARGVPVGCRPIKTVADIAEALNQQPWLSEVFRKGDRIKKFASKSADSAVFDGEKFHELLQDRV